MKYLLVVLLVFSLPLCARENSSTLYKQGAALAGSGDIDGAIVIFKKVILLSPYYAMGHYGLGKAYLTKTGKNADAVKELRAACKLDPSLPRAHFYLGLAYWYTQEYIPAIHAFDEAYKRDRTMIDALYNIGALYETMGNSYKAQKYYTLWYTKKNSAQEDIFNF